VKLAIFTQLWRRHRLRVLAISCGALGWGFLAPVIYKAVFGSTALQSLPSVITKFGSGNVSTLGGVITIMYEHPFLVAMVLAVGISVATAAVAGARTAGTLELTLARPVSRRALVAVTALATATMLAVVLLAFVAGTMAGAAFEGISGSLPLASLPLIWVESLLLFGAFASFALLTSTLSDRSSPALSVALAYVLANYFVEVLGSLWQAAAPYQKYSLFAHFLPNAIIGGDAAAGDALILLAAVVVPLAAALWAFPRRDLAAPG
jgi:ABC-type transport system involved in multi-copper enzyme maturation permease subunit